MQIKIAQAAKCVFDDIDIMMSEDSCYVSKVILWS